MLAVKAQTLKYGRVFVLGFLLSSRDWDIKALQNDFST